MFPLVREPCPTRGAPPCPGGGRPDDGLRKGEAGEAWDLLSGAGGAGFGRLMRRAAAAAGVRRYRDLLTVPAPPPTRTEASRAKCDNPNAKAELVEVPKGRYNSSSPGVTSLRRKINGTHSRNGIHLN